MVNHTPEPKASMHKNNSHPCNNFINDAIYFKINAIHITGRYKKWSFPNDMDYNMTLYSFIPIFSNKDLSKYQRKFMKHAIDQFSIELYHRIFADKLFSMFINSFQIKPLRPLINGVFALAWQLQIRFNQAIFPNFVADLFFNTTDVFLSFCIDAILFSC